MIAQCPDHYEPIPAMAAPPNQQDKNHNGNLFLCAKGPQGSNEHFNIKDDKDQTLSPTEWNVQAFPAYGVWVITWTIDMNSQYYLDTPPEDVVDDTLPL
jgi:hypothetical protein